MLARSIGMFSLKSKMSLTKSTLSLIQTHKRRLDFLVEKEIKGIGRCARLTNNLDLNKLKSKSSSEIDKILQNYKSDSWNQFESNLLPSHLHIYVHAAHFATSKDPLVAGHVASFVTDIESNILEHTVMSLQNGDEYISDNNGDPLKVIGKLDEKERSEYLYTVAFASIKDEVNKFSSKAKDSPHKHIRHLISIPINQEETNLIKEFVAHTIALYGNRYYQLFDGKINSEFYKALNCCLGFYSSMGVKGKRSNPSPQLVAWSYLKFIFDERITNNLIKGTIVDDKYINDENFEINNSRVKLPKLTGKALRDLLLSKSGLKENSTITADDVIERIKYKP